MIRTAFDNSSYISSGDALSFSGRHSGRMDTPQPADVVDLTATSGGRSGNGSRKTVHNVASTIMSRLIDRKKKSPVDLFFAGDVKRIRPVKQGPDKEHPRGCWRVHNLTDPGGSSHLLDLEAPVNKVYFSYNDQWLGLKHFPFERWTRIEDGWLGESVVGSEDPKMSGTLFSTYLGDNGDFEMAVIECAKGGGGAIYRLDSNAYLRNPGRIPSVLDTHIFSASEKTPPFPLHTSLGRADMEKALQFFPRNEFEAEYRPASELFGRCGWQIKVSRPADASDLEDFLDARSPRRSVAEVKDPYERAFRYTHWEKTGEGWQNITLGKLPPEQADVLKSCELKTVLQNDGSISMRIYERFHDGRCCVTELDGNEFLRTPHKPPAILSERFMNEGTKEDNKEIEIPGCSIELDGKSEGMIREEGDWIIIGGTKLEIKRDSAQLSFRGKKKFELLYKQTER